MSATAAPFGLRPVGNLGGNYNGSFRQYPILSTESTAIVFGDVVKLTDAGTTTTIQKDTGTTSATPIGIFMGCRYTDISTGQTQFSQVWSGAAHTNGMVYVATEDGTSGYLWYLKAESETRLRFEDYLEMSMVEAEKDLACATTPSGS